MYLNVLTEMCTNLKTKYIQLAYVQFQMMQMDKLKGTNLNAPYYFLAIKDDDNTQVIKDMKIFFDSFNPNDQSRRYKLSLNEFKPNIYEGFYFTSDGN